GCDLRGQLGYGGTLGVGLLPGREFTKLGVALQVEIGIGQIGLILGFLGLGLSERRLEWARIDLGRQVALVDQLPFLEGDLVDLAIDERPHHHRVEAMNRSEPGPIHYTVSLTDRFYA